MNCLNRSTYPHQQECCAILEWQKYRESINQTVHRENAFDRTLHWSLAQLAPGLPPSPHFPLLYGTAQNGIETIHTPCFTLALSTKREGNGLVPKKLNEILANPRLFSGVEMTRQRRRRILPQLLTSILGQNNTSAVEKYGLYQRVLARLHFCTHHSDRLSCWHVCIVENPKENCCTSTGWDKTFKQTPHSPRSGRRSIKLLRLISLLNLDEVEENDIGEWKTEIKRERWSKFEKDNNGRNEMVRKWNGKEEGDEGWEHE